MVKTTLNLDCQPVIFGGFLKSASKIGYKCKIDKIYRKHIVFIDFRINVQQLRVNYHIWSYMSADSKLMKHEDSL